MQLECFFTAKQMSLEALYQLIVMQMVCVLPVGSRIALSCACMPACTYSHSRIVDQAACGVTGILVGNTDAAYQMAVQNGAVSAQEPTTLTDPTTGAQQRVAEVQLYGDVVLRLVSGSYEVCATHGPSQCVVSLQRMRAPGCWST